MNNEEIRAAYEKEFGAWNPERTPDDSIGNEFWYVLAVFVGAALSLLLFT